MTDTRDEGREIMNAQAAVPKDAPLMVAWEAFMQTEDYANCLRWLNRKDGSPTNGIGELWTAFCAGWNAAGGEQPFRADPSGEVGEEIEDMRARKDAAYTERNRCVVAMAHMARALGWTVYASEHDPEDTEWEGDWRAILVVESPEGQLTWHFHDSQRAMLEGFDLRLYEWDGHDTPEKYRRLEESLARLRRTPEDRPRIVCLCGSTRFSQAWIDATRERSLAGEIVLSVGVMIHAGAEPIRDDSPEKQALDDLHLRKIDLADYVLVLNVDGYIGDSTRREIKYADAMGKRVEYLEPLSTPEKSERDD